MHLNISIVPSGLSDRDSLGEWDARAATINFDSFLAEDVLRETLLHEIMHAILEHTDVAQEQHEDIIRAMSPLMLNFIRSNPNFIGWLQD